MHKLFLTLITSLLIPFSTFAHDPSSLLHQSMQQLGKISKQINATISDPSQNTLNAANAKKMGELFKIAFDHANEAVEDFPADQQSAAIAEIQNLTSQEGNLASQLQAAFTANDNTSAKLIWQKMQDLKDQGHDKYN